jgi:hypothetical protein
VSWSNISRKSALTSPTPSGQAVRLGGLVTQLLEVGVPSHSDGGYHLTDHGLSLMAALKPLQAWAEDWAQRTASATSEPHHTITHR